MKPMHDKYGKSDHQKFLDYLKRGAGVTRRPFSSTGKLGNETVVVWLMLGGVVGGLLTRSLLGAAAGAVLVYVGWWLGIKAFGGRFMSQRLKPTMLFRWGVFGAIGGFASPFLAGLAGLSLSLFLMTGLGAAAGVALYQFVLAKRTPRH